MQLVLNPKWGYQVLPGKDRERSSVLEIQYDIPPKTIFTIELEVERLFLHWT